MLMKKLPNDPTVMVRSLKAFKGRIKGIVVEYTYNCYWVVDCLMADGYCVHLANPSAIQRYAGLKYCDDVHDVFWLVEQLRLGILPVGYIYPK
jgi:transposase